VPPLSTGASQESLRCLRAGKEIAGSPRIASLSAAMENVLYFDLADALADEFVCNSSVTQNRDVRRPPVERFVGKRCRAVGQLVKQ